MTLTGIFAGDILYSLHLDPSEADYYLKDLQLVHTDQTFDIRDVETGRCSGEEKVVWSSVGAVDLEKGEVLNFRRVWRFPDQHTPIAVGPTTESRFVWFCLPLNNEADFIKAVKPILSLRRDPKTGVVS